MSEGMTARERIESILNDHQFWCPSKKEQYRRQTDAILEIVPGLCEVCEWCGGEGWYIDGSGPDDLIRYECDCHDGIRIKQDRQEGEDGNIR